MQQYKNIKCFLLYSFPLNPHTSSWNPHKVTPQARSPTLPDASFFWNSFTLTAVDNHCGKRNNGQIQLEFERCLSAQPVFLWGEIWGNGYRPGKKGSPQRRVRRHLNSPGNGEFWLKFQRTRSGKVPQYQAALTASRWGDIFHFIQSLGHWF